MSRWAPCTLGSCYVIVGRSSSRTLSAQVAGVVCDNTCYAIACRALFKAQPRTRALLTSTSLTKEHGHAAQSWEEDATGQSLRGTLLSDRGRAVEQDVIDRKAVQNQ